jgi:hypothetical protein
MNKSITGFGLDFEEVCSKFCVKKLGFQQPRMGYELHVANEGMHRLVLQNLSGTLVLASPTTPKIQWTDVFGHKFNDISQKAYLEKQIQLNGQFVAAVEHLFEVDHVPQFDLLRFAPRVASLANVQGASYAEMEEAVARYGAIKGLSRHQVAATHFERQRG